MQYKVLALDLDGTLTNTEKVITPRTKAALQEAARRGVCIVLASGRPTVGIEPLARELELEKYAAFVPLNKECCGILEERNMNTWHKTKALALLTR